MLKTLLTIVGLSAVVAIPAQSLLLSLKAGKANFRELFEHTGTLLKYILTMFIITPLLAVIFFWIFGPREGLWVAIFVIAVTPASPGMVKKMSRLSGEHNVSIAWMITTIFLSLIFIPLNLTIVQNYVNLNVDLGIDDVFLKLMLMFILPMAIGFLITKYLSKHSGSIIKIFDPVTKIAMLGLVVSLLVLSGPLIISKGIIPILFILAFILAALIIAHFMGTPEKLFGPILPYSVISRLPAPAIILMQINNTVEKHMSVVITYTILGVIVMILYDKLILKSSNPEKQNAA